MDTAPGRDFIREFQSATAASPLPETFLESVIDASAKVPLRVWRQALDDLLDARQDVAHGAIQIPTLLIWGEQDAVFSAQDQTALLASIPTAQLARYPDCGHAPHWEQPQRLALELLDFVHSLTPARASAAA
jgi:pimeloyl-ACP methyl ester carboxylesterase